MSADSVWVIYNKAESIRNEAFIQILENEFQKHNLELLLLIDENIEFVRSDCTDTILYKKKEIDKPRFILNRKPNYILSRAFEEMGFLVFNNSKVSEICNDKLTTYEFLYDLGAPVLDTELLISTKQLFFPSVIKPADSKGGEGVFLLNNIEDYIAVEDYIADRKYIIQKPATEMGKDVRVYVIGSEIIVAIMRESSSDFRSNYSLGGKASLYTLNEHETRIIKNITQHLKSDFIGIDFMFDSDGIVINEIEDVVGSRMVYSLTDINIASIYVNHVVETSISSNRS